MNRVTVQYKRVQSAKLHDAAAIAVHTQIYRERNQPVCMGILMLQLNLSSKRKNTVSHGFYRALGFL
jgi:hypothetical protein